MVMKNNWWNECELRKWISANKVEHVWENTKQ